MKKTLLTLSIAAIVLGSLAVSTQNAKAYRGDPAVKGPNYTAEREALMEKAFETNDYNSWAKLMEGRGRVTKVINANNFSQFAKAHELAEEGKISEAQEIRQSLGLGLQNGEGGRGNMRNGTGLHQNQW